MKKELKFTIITKESKTVIAEQLVTFGSKDKPFPKDWQNDPLAQIGIYEHKQQFLNSILDVEVSEDISDFFTLVPKTEPMFTIEQIKTYLLSKDSMGDMLYYLSADNILNANEKDEDE